MNLVRKGDVILVEDSMLSLYLVTWILVTFNATVLILQVLGFCINVNSDVAVVSIVKMDDACLSYPAECREES
jgi:hypothetical protein